MLPEVLLFSVRARMTHQLQLAYLDRIPEVLGRDAKVRRLPWPVAYCSFQQLRRSFWRRAFTD